MGGLYLTQIQPNPPGRDVTRSGAAPGQLNAEWVEFAVVGGNRNLSGDVLSHLTFTTYGCTVTGSDPLWKFGALELQTGHRVRIHTGSGNAWWEGLVLHVYVGRGWFVWNNGCGDRAVLDFNGNVVDWAEYGPNPREGVLVRVQNTNRFV